MDKQIIKQRALVRKRKRVRKNIRGDSQRPRLSVFRSGQHIYGQLIDDDGGVTLLSASSMSKDLRETVKDLGGVALATRIGEALGEKAVAAGINAVVFDRNGRRYTGRVKALADGARSKGLQF